MPVRLSSPVTFVVGLLLGASAVAGSASLLASAQQDPATVPALPPQAIRGVRLDLEFPAVGNVDAVRQWRFARVDRVDTLGANDPDIQLHLRLADGTVVSLRAPGAPLDQLARQSNWLTSPDRQTPGRADYIERMVAFDADADGRLIAIASLEPTARNRNRLRQALSR